MPKGKKSRVLSVRVPKAVADKVDRLCEERGATVNEVLGELVVGWLLNVVRDAVETVAVAPVARYTAPVSAAERHSVNSDSVRTAVRYKTQIDVEVRHGD